MALPVINCQSFIISQKDFDIFLNSPLHTKSAWVKKIFTQRPLRPYPSRQLARLTKGTQPSKKMRPVPQKTGCVHKRGKIPLSVMHM